VSWVALFLAIAKSFPARVASVRLHTLALPACGHVAIATFSRPHTRRPSSCSARWRGGAVDAAYVPAHSLRRLFCDCPAPRRPRPSLPAPNPPHRPPPSELHGRRARGSFAHAPLATEPCPGAHCCAGACLVCGSRASAAGLGHGLAIFG